MKYQLNKTNFNDFSVFEINKLPGRSYIIPYSNKETLSRTPFIKERYSSDIVKVLSGKWEFSYYASSKDLPDVLDTAKAHFDTINVPSTWQRTGYDSPAYINCPYAFDDKPPYVPEEQPIGVYRKCVEIESKKKKYIISFLGVVSCLDLYINGKFVGYSEGAHNTAEFDITDFVKKGSNELIAVVHKWSNGTFLECQDMFRENGIFRDVLLYELPDAYINDVYFQTIPSSKGWTLKSNIRSEGKTENCLIKVSLFDKSKLICEKTIEADDGILEFSNLDVQPWNAEIPKLYTAFTTLIKNNEEIMSVRNFIGFKSVKIKKDIFTVNGKSIKIKGVNHHDTNYKTGYCMTTKDIETDIKLMKSLNVNGVRTSHYPPDAQFLVLCDIYGLYVIDEADIETHGCGCSPHNNIDLISSNKKWAPRYLDRVMRMYMRDRSRACVIMWSLGNESGGYACQDVCYDFLHSVNPEIPVHYEGVIRTLRHSYDVVSEMYTSHKNVEKCGKHTRGKKYTKKPFYLCEYAHAMGEGPGGLEEYWKIIYKYENLMGGCIWEWADHSVYHANGKYKYTYGGDHGEWRHDGCFCVDGLMYPDRRLHTGAREMKNVYRPVRASYSNKAITFTNTNRFRNSSYLTAVYECVKNGNILLAADELVLDIEPNDSISVPYNIAIPKDKCDIHINVYYYDGDQEIACEQLAVKENFSVEIPKVDGKATVNEDNESVNVNFGNGSLVISKKYGQLESYIVDGVQYINQTPAKNKGFLPNVYRAYTDNDVRRKAGWQKAGYNDYHCNVKDISITKGTKDIKIDVAFRLISNNTHKAFAEVNVKYDVKYGGVIDIFSSFNPVSKKTVAKDIPRFGLTVEMPDNFNEIEYYGSGPYENLPDYYAQSTLGVYNTNVEDMFEPYVRPQENGNHCNTRYVKVMNEEGKGLQFCYGNEYLIFNARKFSQDLLEKAGHIEDVRSEHTVAVEIDGFIRGAGTASCGPDVLDEFVIDASKGLNYKFTIIPIK